MKQPLQYLLAFCLLLGPFFGNAQEPAQVKFHKDKPVQILQWERLYDPNNTKVSERKLRKSGRFTDAEVAEIFRRLADDKLLPANISVYDDKWKLPYYKAYEQSSFSLLGFNFVMVWIPKDENAALPVDMQPPAPEGIVYYTYRKHLSYTGQDASGNALPVAGTRPGAAAASTAATSGSNPNVSAADMSQFTQQANQGVMILYYGSGGAASSAYLYELKGPALTSKSAVADELSAKVAASEPMIGYEHLAMSDCRSAEGYIKKKAGNGIWVHCSGTHSVK